MTEEEMFFARVSYSEDCWEWDGSVNKNGYGIFNYNYGYIRAHRWAYSFFIQPIEPGKMICHHCDNRKCVNPFHLFQGTAKDNALDMMGKNRQHYKQRTHCINGHELSVDNITIRSKSAGWRECLECIRLRNKERYAREALKESEE